MPKDPMGVVSLSELEAHDFKDAIPNILGAQRSARSSSGGSLQQVIALLREQRQAEAQAERERRAEMRFQWQLEERREKEAKKRAEEQAQRILNSPPEFPTPEGFDELPFSEQMKLYEEWIGNVQSDMKTMFPEMSDLDLDNFRDKIEAKSPPPGKPSRSTVEAAGDIAGGFGAGTVQLLQSALGFFADADNPAMTAMDSAVDWLTPSSDVEKDRQKQIAFDLQRLEEAYEAGDMGPWRRFFEEAGVQVRNMSLAGLSELAGNVLPTMALGGGVGLAARGAALRLPGAASAVTRGSTAAASAAEKAAATQAVKRASDIGQVAAGVVGAATEGLSTGGEARMETYKEIMNLSPEVLQGSEAWARASQLAESDDPAAIQQTLATLASNDSRWRAGTLGALLSGVGGTEAIARRGVGRISRRRADAAGLPPPVARDPGRLQRAGTLGLDLTAEAATEVVPTAVTNLNVLRAQGEDPSITDPRLYPGTGAEAALGVLGAGGGHVGTRVAERVLGRGGEATSEGPAPIPEGDQPPPTPEGAPLIVPISGTTVTIFGTTVMRRPGEWWGYLPGAVPNEEADTFINSQNSQLVETGEMEGFPPPPRTTVRPVEPEGEPTATPDPEGEPTATPDPEGEPTATPDPEGETTATPDPEGETTATPDPEGEPTATPDPEGETTATPDPEGETTATFGPAVQARLEAVETYGGAFAKITEELRPLVTELQQKMNDPAQITHVVQEISNRFRSWSPELRETLSSTIREVIDEGHLDAARTEALAETSPLTYAVLRLGAGTNVETLSARWAEALRNRRSSEEVLQTMADDPLTGPVSNMAAALLSMYAEAGVPLPTYKLLRIVPKSRRGAFDSGPNLIRLYSNSVPNTVAHEFTHGLLRMSAPVLAAKKDATTQASLKMLREVRDALQAASDGRYYYGAFAAYRKRALKPFEIEEMMTELMNPEFLALASQIRVEEALTGEALKTAQELLQNRRGSTLFDLLVAALDRVLQAIAPRSAPSIRGSLAEVLAAATAERTLHREPAPIERTRVPPQPRALPPRVEASATPAPVTPAPSYNPNAKLPAELSTASPRYNNRMPRFESDIDLAAYIVRNKKDRSKRDADYMQWLRDATGWTEEQARAHGDRVLKAVKDAVNKHGAKIGRVEVPSVTPAATAAGLASRASRTTALSEIPQRKDATGPIPEIVEAAENYAQSQGISLSRQQNYVEVDEAFARRIAEAYEAMEHAPNDPQVREAYQQLIEQTRAQYDALVEAGYSFTFMGSTDPYNGNPWNAMRDLRANKHMAVFPTAVGYGTDPSAIPAEHPLLGDSGLQWPDSEGNLHPVLFNDLFRAVHDAFGHGLEGAGFRARGEENAWQAHARMFTGAAVGALTSETRGQNSWLNYGPHGEQNRTAKLSDTIFADQKAGLMPEWTWTEHFDDGADPSILASEVLTGIELLDEDVRAFPEEEDASYVAYQMAKGVLGEEGVNPTPTEDPEFAPPRETPAEALGRLERGEQLSPTTISRGIWQALRKKDFKTVGNYVITAGEKLNDTLHDSLGVVERWLASLPIFDNPEGQRAVDRVRYSLRLAPGRRDDALAEANKNYGGFKMVETIRKVSSELGVNVETAKDWLGRWTSARYAKERNEWLIGKTTNLVSRTAKKAAEARQELSDLQNSGRASENALAEAQAKVRVKEGIARRARRRLDKTVKGVFDPRPKPDERLGPTAGYTNAEAAYFMELIERQVPKKYLEQAAEAMYDMNAWALTLDVESGRTSPSGVVQFLNKPEIKPLLESLRSAAIAYSSASLSEGEAALSTLEGLRKQVAAAVRSRYIPLTGDPKKQVAPDSFGANARQPNTARDRALWGRTSLPDEGITTTLNRLVRSASYAGWAPFQDAVANLYDHLSEDQRRDAGIRKVKGSRTREPSASELVRRRASGVEVYEFRDERILGAIQDYNKDASELYTRFLGAPSRAYAYMATQANLLFGVKVLVRDAWERSEIIRTKEIFREDGTKVNTDKVARRILSYVFDPFKNMELFAATARFAFKRNFNKDSYAGRSLQELAAMGGLSVRSDTFTPTSKQLLRDANKGRLFRAVRDFIDAYNRTFDLIPILASHMALREAGLTTEVAAAEALDLFNFRKRGTLTRFISTGFSFSQTSFTGGANFIGTLFNPNSKAKKYGNTHFLRKGVVRFLGTTVVFMAIQSMARMLAGDDEAGNKIANLNPFIQDSNLILPIPGGEKYFRIPLSFGPARVTHGLARSLLGIGHKEVSPKEAMGKFLVNNLNTVLTPFEGTSIDFQRDPFQALATIASPSWFKPITAVLINRDPNDIPIVYDSFQKTTEYRSEQFGRNVAKPYKEVARWLRRTLGVDLAPEEVEHLIKSYPTGTIGQVRRMLIDNPHLEERGRPTTNPFIGSFVGAYGDSGKISQFYAGLDKSDEIQRRLSVGDSITAADRKVLAWRSWWDELDAQLRKTPRKITNDPLLSEEQKKKRMYDYANKRREQQILAVYRLRQLQGKTPGTTQTVKRL